MLNPRPKPMIPFQDRVDKAVLAVDKFIATSPKPALSKDVVRRIMFGVRAGRQMEISSAETILRYEAKIANAFPEATLASGVAKLADEVGELEEVQLSFEYHRKLSLGIFPIIIAQRGNRPLVYLPEILKFSTPAVKAITNAPSDVFVNRIVQLREAMKTSFKEFPPGVEEVITFGQLRQDVVDHMNRDRAVVESQCAFGELLVEPKWSERDLLLFEHADSIFELRNAIADSRRGRVMTKGAESLWQAFLAQAEDDLLQDLGISVKGDPLATAYGYCDLVSGIQPRQSTFSEMTL